MVFNFVKTSSHCKVGFLECFSLNIPVFSFLSVFFNWSSLFSLQMEIWVFFFVGMINSQIPYNIRYKLGYLLSSLIICCTKWTLYVMAIVVRWVDLQVIHGFCPFESFFLCGLLILKDLDLVSMSGNHLLVIL